MMRTFTHMALAGMLAVLYLASCVRQQDPTAEGPVVMTSIEPLADWIARIGGPGIRVLTLIPSTADPHLFELSPAQLRQAERAAAAVFIGAGMEAWSGRLLGASTLASDRVLYLADELSLPHGDGHTHDAGSDPHEDHSSVNPHIWLDPMLAHESITHIQDLLVRLVPDSADAIGRRADAYRDSLLALHREILAARALWTSDAFVSDHNTWAHFARRYGLRVAAVLERVPGRDASAGELREIIRLVRDGRIGGVFADERSARRSALQLSRELDLPLLTLRPTRTEGDYLAMMRENLSLMTRVMNK